MKKEKPFLFIAAMTYIGLAWGREEQVGSKDAGTQILAVAVYDKAEITRQGTCRYETLELFSVVSRR
jgi:hypothetical protein